jgi:hypothetical protein
VTVLPELRERKAAERKQLHTEDLINLHSSSNIVRKKEKSIMQVRNAYKLSSENT